MKQSKIINFFLSEKAQILYKLMDNIDDWLYYSNTGVSHVIKHNSGVVLQYSDVFSLIQYFYPIKINDTTKTIELNLIKLNFIEEMILYEKFKKLRKIFSQPKTPESISFVEFFNNWKNNETK